MIRSMTGYGRGEHAGPTGTYFVEVSSTNHRFLEVKARLPRGWIAHESRIQKEISGRFKRGHFDFYLAERNKGERQGGLGLDWDLAEQYVQSLKLLKKRLGLSGRVDLRLVGEMREIFSSEEHRITEVYWEDAQKAISQALEGLEGMRRKEGLALEAQIQAGLLEAQRLLNTIASRWPEARREHQRRIGERIAEIMQGQEIDQGRLEQELALWAERWDIAEEVARLQSHLQQAQGLLIQDSPSGRPFDFLLQEMHREANTISAKASDAPISHQIIGMKMELEKLREQVQNVE